MPGKQLNPQHPVPQQQHKLHHLADRIKKNMETVYIDQGELVKASKRAQFSKTLQELREAVTVL